MKTSVSLSLFKALPNAPVLFSNQIEKNIPYIKEIGYQGVDLFVADPEAEISQKALKLLRQHDLGVGAVMPAALAGQGLFLAHKDPGIRQEIVRRMKAIINYAAQAGAMVSLGLVRGSMAEGEQSPALALERFKQTIEKLLPYSEQHGVDLLIEPINRYEINTLNSSQQAYDFIQQTGLPLYLMLDTFHMNIEDISLHDSLIYCQDRIKHIHFLDSNRLAPGMGHLDMLKIVRTLEKIKYNGYLCLEALARPDEKTCALNGIRFFRQIGLLT